MGQCQSGGFPVKISLEELAGIKVGEKYESQKGCGPNIDGIQGGSGYQQLIDKGFGWPDNGEFEWGGLGSNCYLCSNVSSYGCDCGDGRGASVDGKRGTIKRISYKGDKKNCCISQGKFDGNYTCDPALQDLGSGACDNSLVEFCSLGDNIVSNQVCKNWAAKNPVASKNISLGYCSINNNMGGDFCKTFCSQNKEACSTAQVKFCQQDNNMATEGCRNFCFSNPGLCDSAVLSYCSKNPGDTNFCGCINIPNNLTVLTKSGISLKPQCNIQKCLAAGAYKTNAMLNDKTCPTINICEQSLNIASLDKSQLKGVTFSCSQTTSSSQAPAPIQVPVTEQPRIKIPSLNNTSIAIIIAIIIAILFLSSLSIAVGSQV